MRRGGSWSRSGGPGGGGGGGGGVCAPPGRATDAIEGVRVRRYRYAPRAWETLAYTGTMAEQVSGSLRGKLALALMLWRGRRAVRAVVRAWRPQLVPAHWGFPSGMMG